jgi:hypothetical protein
MLMQSMPAPLTPIQHAPMQQSQFPQAPAQMQSFAGLAAPMPQHGLIPTSYPPPVASQIAASANAANAAAAAASVLAGRPGELVPAYQISMQDAPLQQQAQLVPPIPLVGAGPHQQSQAQASSALGGGGPASGVENALGLAGGGGLQGLVNNNGAQGGGTPGGNVLPSRPTGSLPPVPGGQRI